VALLTSALLVRRIINEVRGINRVVYGSDKRPSTHVASLSRSAGWPPISPAEGNLGNYL
jgi:hypothetical protein